MSTVVELNRRAEVNLDETEHQVLVANPSFAEEIQNAVETREGTRRPLPAGRDGETVTLAGGHWNTRRDLDWPRIGRKSAGAQPGFMRALTEPQLRQVLGADGKPMVGPDGKPVKVEVAMAMHLDLVQAYQRIARRAVDGKDLKYFLKMVEIMAKVVDFGEKNGNGHGNGHMAREPIAPVFIRPEPQAAEPEAEEPARPDGSVTLNGEEYA
jgi:hypothetical protein